MCESVTDFFVLWLDAHRLQNLRFAESELLLNCRTSCVEARKQAGEIARDAYDYSLTKEMLDERVVRFKKTALALTKGRAALTGASGVRLAATSGSSNGSAWPAVFQGVDDSDTRRFADFRSALDREMEDIRRAEPPMSQSDAEAADAGGGLGGHDMEDEEGNDQAGGNPFAEPVAMQSGKNPFA